MELEANRLDGKNETVGSADSLLVREVRASPTTSRPVMTIVAPIKKSNRHLGTIAMAIELNSVSEKIIDNVSSDEDYKTLILNSSGLVISSDNPDHVLSLNFQEEAGLQDFFETMGSEKTGVGFLTLDGLKCFAAYNHSSTYGMYFITYKIRESLYEAARCHEKYIAWGLFNIHSHSNNHYLFCIQKYDKTNINSY